VRLKSLESLLNSTVQKLTEESAFKEVAVATVQTEIKLEPPGFITIRTLSYKNQTLDVPYILRDAFLLPQRFSKSETFLIRLAAEQQSRIMSEYSNSLEGLHKHVKRYNEKNDETLFEELKLYIEEEKIRRNLTIERHGELFFFHKADHIVVTEELSKIPLNPAQFNGIPSLLRQLNEDQIETVGQLPRELVILAKYESVGVGTVEKLFEQLKSRQIIY
jgi:hypothetical protein